MKLIALPRTLILIITLCVVGTLIPAVASAQGPAPLPLPDLLIYGTAARDGVTLESGTVKALLPRGSVVSAEIAPISGTDYTYVLAIPMSMYDAGVTTYAADSVRQGESISFQIDDTPALFVNDNGITANTFVVPTVGEYIVTATVVDLFLSGPAAYLLGDVNASGWRDSADALLVLKYDVGLIEGVTDFPPGPRTVYLPLCDIVEDGACNASDALRILQCDAGMTNVSCPIGPTAAAVEQAPTTSDTPAAEAPDTTDVIVNFNMAVAAGPEPDTILVRVLTEDPQTRLGAATLALGYAADRLTPEQCSSDPDGAFDMALCNLDYAPDAVALNAIAVEGVGGSAVVAELRFRLLDPTLLTDPAAIIEALAPVLTLTPRGVFDITGEALDWQMSDVVEFVPPPPGGGAQHLYLPLMMYTQPVSALEASPDASSVATETPIVEDTPTPTPDEATPAPDEATPNADQVTPTPDETTPIPDDEATPTSEEATPVPDEATATPAMPDIDQEAPLDPTPAVGPESIPVPELGSRLYLPLVSGRTQ